MVSQEQEIERFLAGFPPEVRALAWGTRALILKLAPKITEQVDPPGRIIGYGFGTRYADMVCVIMPTKAGVNLGFYRGAELSDPKGLLEGTGKLHRHVKLRASADLTQEALRPLFKAALAAWKRRARGDD